MKTIIESKTEYKNPLVVVSETNPENPEDCFICGSPCELTASLVSLVDCGGAIHHHEDLDVAEFDGEYVGCYAVGSGCARKLAKSIKDLGLNPSDYIERGAK
jgi:hypothetical protein